MKRDIKHYLQGFENKEGLRLFFSLLKEFISTLNLDAKSEKLAINWRDDLNRIHVSLNSRLVFGITHKADFLFMANVEDYQELSEKIHFIKHEKFDMQKPDAKLLYIDYKQFTNNLPLIKALWLKSCKEYEPVQDKSKYRPHHINELYEITMDETKLEVNLKAQNPKILDLIERYKNHIRNGGLSDEIYKWELVQKFKGRPNINAENFGNEIIEVDPDNLVYRLTRAVSKRIISYDSNRYRECFRMLFNEEIDLKKRVSDFNKEVLSLYKDTEGKNSPHHDERTISTYLTLHNPEKYTFYKSTYYLEYCDFIGEKSKESGDKYVHYLELINDLIRNYILEDNDLINLIDSNLDYKNCYSDLNRKILAQDILYQMFDKKSVIKYWVFQGSPKVYRLVDALNANVIQSFSVTKYKSQIKEGDKIILWLTGDNAGVYAIAEATSDVEIIDENEIEYDYYIEKPEKKSSSRVEVRILHNLADKPLLKKEILLIPELKDLNQGRQGTNFKATELQYKTILNLITMQTLPKYTQNQPLNQILYGPPGTGKTYNTINKAIAIVNPDFNLNQPREIIKKEYSRLVETGQIVFITFHQSMSYEDFIEGIKPETLNNQVFYNIQNGVFKKLCQSAQTPNQTDFNSAYEKLQKDLTENEQILLKTPTGKEYKIGLNSNGNLSLYTGLKKELQGTLTKENIQRQINGENMFDGWGGYFKGVVQYLESQYEYSTKSTKEIPNYVLIIDEINRGNVSQIFGELITLIEEDKRLGNTESLEVTLPYSKEKFGVPPNLYIIGTMNTADRSVEALDAALRRRFSFEEIPSKPNLIATVGKAQKGMIGEIDLVELLGTINKRIEVLLDKDHQIGHSYFLSVSNIRDLKTAFQCKIIPLLQEYFFGDYGKIGLVLGGGFVLPAKKENGNLFAKFSKEYDDSDYADRIIYRIVNIEKMQEFEFITAVLTLLNK